MKKIFIYTAIFVTIATACSKLENKPIQKGDEKDSDVKMVTEKVTGTRESSSKVTISNDATPAFSWTVGDNIAVHVTNGVTNKYVFTSDAGASGASTSAATASFTVAYEEGYARDAFAIYPSTIVSASAANYGQSGQPLDVTLPSSYTLDQVTGTTSPCPMIATNTAGSGWTFKQLCGLLRLTVNNIPPSAKRLEIDFDGKKVSGDFSLAAPVSPETSFIATSDDETHDIITIIKDGSDVTLNNNAWLDGLVLNISLPTGTYTNIIITAYDALSGGKALLSMTRPFAYTASKTRGKKQTASFPVFSVSASKRVLFAPGNLQYNSVETPKWRFAEHQYTMIGAARWSTSGWMDAFGWGTWTGDSPNPTNTSTNSSDYTWDSKDFVGDPTGNGYTWYTLSQSEWSYLISRSYIVTITDLGTGVYGAILLPDDWPSPTSLPTLTNIRTYDAGNKITLDQWKGFENYGAVFLPAAGNYSKNSPYDNNNPNKLRYLSGTSKDGTNAYIFKSNNSKYTPAIEVNYDVKASKFSVRLVREVE
ncbi:MAG: hypothetical protein J5604_04570 [Bacteroidales bacterium]|nr:hypothetical protein [Bacteroidales bacterium]